MKTIDYFISRYQSIIPNFELFIEKIQISPVKLLRPNFLKIASGELGELFKRHYGEDLLSRSTHRFENYLIKDEKFSIGGSLEHLMGYFYVQGYSSQLAVEILDPRPHEKVLDLCAAPGGKTVLIAEKMKNTGFLLANELYINRNIALKANIDRCGVFNCLITNMNGDKLLKDRAEYFDRVLLDGPCSSEGTLMLDQNENLPFKNDHEFRKALMHTQVGLMTKAFEMLKKGGVLVYSTCTYAPEENEYIVNELLMNNENAKIEEIERVENYTNGLTEWNENSFRPELNKTVRVYPHLVNSWGFYVAKIRKL